MRGKKRVYICDSNKQRIIDIYIVEQDTHGGDVYRTYRKLYFGLVAQHQLSWSENNKYLKEHGFK